MRRRRLIWIGLLVLTACARGGYTQEFNAQFVRDCTKASEAASSDPGRYCECMLDWMHENVPFDEIVLDEETMTRVFRKGADECA